VGEEDRVLVVVTNQYMFEQILWYRTRYPEGIWEALIIKFGDGNDSLMDIMNQKCLNCGFFEKIVFYDRKVSEQSICKKIGVMMQYVYQYFMGTREKHDRKLIECIMGRCDYKKVIIHSTVSSSISVAALNAMSDEVLVCLEDGLGDYLPVKRTRFCTELFNFLLAKTNIVNAAVFDHQFQLKYDRCLIKYCSLPNKMKYRNYKIIKGLFENDDRELDFSNEELLLRKENYDVVVFSTIISDYGNYEELYYNALYDWLKKNYQGKKILFKPHPREKCNFCWDDLDVYVGGEKIAGERLLDLMPDVEIVFTYTTTILLKACREKRDFKVLCFNQIKSKWYHQALKNDSEVLGLREEDWVIL